MSRLSDGSVTAQSGCSVKFGSSVISSPPHSVGWTPSFTHRGEDNIDDRNWRAQTHRPDSTKIGAGPEVPGAATPLTFTAIPKGPGEYQTRKVADVVK